jgi:hypothetical protein
LTPDDIELIRQVLPERMAYPYYRDRESAWLLARRMPGDESVRQLRQGGCARYLDRPILRPLIAGCGGQLRRADVATLAHADRMIDGQSPGPAAMAALEQVWSGPWHDFELTFDSWGTGNDWWAQTSRRGGNLVLQMGFPSDHARLMGKYLARAARKDFEFDSHPIRTQGRPTLAWARLDIDLESGVALIEEVQSDWLRNVQDEVAWLTQQEPRSRHLRSTRAYDTALRAAYGKLWPRAMLLAALIVLRDELGMRELFMHMPETGRRLKRIGGLAPPVSLYSALPKSLGFEAVTEAPVFLRKRRRRDLSVLERRGPVFWRMVL